MTEQSSGQASEQPQPPGTPMRDDQPDAPTGADREPRGEVDESHLEEPVAGSEADHRHGDRPE